MAIARYMKSIVQNKEKNEVKSTAQNIAPKIYNISTRPPGYCRCSEGRSVGWTNLLQGVLSGRMKTINTAWLQHKHDSTLELAQQVRPAGRKGNLNQFFRFKESLQMSHLPQPSANEDKDLYGGPPEDFCVCRFRGRSEALFSKSLKVLFFLDLLNLIEQLSNAELKLG